MGVQYCDFKDVDIDEVDALVVGSGFAGGVMARELAERGGKRVLVVEKRPHIGGNMYDEADEAGIDACPEFYRNDYISMYLKTQGLGERVKVGGAEALRFSVVSTDCSCGDDEKGDFETLGEAMRAAKRLVDVEGYEGAAVYDRKQEAWCAGCNVATVMDMNGPASVTHPFWTITCEAEKREPAQRAAALERAQAIDRAKDAAARTARPSGAHYRPRRAQ